VDSLQWYDYMRLCSVIITIIAAFLFLRRARSRWDQYTHRDKDLLWAFTALLFLMSSGTLEVVMRDAPMRFTTPLSFIISLVCLRAALSKRTDISIIGSKEG
jgi:hypothetical protein